MKKIIVTFTVATVLSLPTMALADDSDIKVVVNQQPQQFNQPPVIINGATLVPLRGIFEALGATVNWDQASQSVTATKGGTTIKLTIGQSTASRNNDQVQLSVPGTIINGSTMVPTRFIAESFGETVDWNGDTRTVLITDQGPNQTNNSVPSTGNAQVNQTSPSTPVSLNTNGVSIPNNGTPTEQDAWSKGKLVADSLNLDGTILSGKLPSLPDGYQYNITYNGLNSDGSHNFINELNPITSSTGDSFSFDCGVKGMLNIRVCNSTGGILGIVTVKIPTMEVKYY